MEHLNFNNFDDDLSPVNGDRDEVLMSRILMLILFFGTIAFFAGMIFWGMFGEFITNHLRGGVE